MLPGSKHIKVLFRKQMSANPQQFNKVNKSQGGNSSTVVDRVEWVQQEPWASVVPCREAGKRLALNQKVFAHMLGA